MAAAFNQTLDSAFAIQYTQFAMSIMKNVSARAMYKALFTFTTFALPTFSQLAEAYGTQTAAQQQFAVLPLPFTSRGYSEIWSTDSNTTGVNEEIQVFDSRAHKLLDQDSHILLLVENKENYAFAHEAPVYFSDKQQLYFCSDAGGKEGRSNSTTNNVVFRVNLNSTIARARAGTSSYEEDVHALNINNDNVQMTNGGTPYHNQLLLINSGRTEAYPPSLTIINRNNASEVKILLNNVAGKQFNALNDVKVNFHTGSIYFTDASYAQSQNFRPGVDLAKATWRFDPLSGRLTMLDASIVTPNGIAISKDGQKLYVTETASNPGGDYAVIPSIPSAIYVFDIVYKHSTEYVQNKRIFTHVNTGVADGVQVDNFENVYSCTGDGLYVWDPNGLLLLRVFFPQGGCVNLVFGGKGRIFVTAQSRLYLVQLAPIVNGPALDTFPRADKRIQLSF